MKKLLLTLIIATCIFNSNAQNMSYPRLGLGLQYSLPAFGLSAKLCLNETHAAQAIFGIIGPISSYAGKYLYYFNETGNLLIIQPYGYAMAGIFKYNFMNTNETGFGYNIGLGIEYYIPLLSENLRPSFEIGFGNVYLDNFSVSSIMFGIGFHYFFGI